MTAMWPSLLDRVAGAPRRLAARVHPLVALLLLFLGSCDSQRPYPSRPVTLICPGALGGGTDRMARQVALHLEQDLGVRVNVLNAPDGNGVSGHLRGAAADADGYTITLMTSELCLFRHLVA